MYDYTGPNKKTKGIPYEDRFTYVRSVVFDGVPDQKNLAEIVAQGTGDTLVTPWSIDVVHGFRDYVPTTFNLITEEMPTNMRREIFGMEDDWEPDSDRVLLQLQSELDAKSATIDAAMLHNRKDFGGIINKTHLINRIYKIGRIHGHLEDRGDAYPFLFGETFHDPATWDNTLMDIKELFMEFFREIPLGRWYAMHTRKAEDEVTPEELKDRFVYVDWLKEKLGDNLQGVLLYGSAARTKDPAGYSDFDNWVRVRDVPAAQKALAGSCPEVYDGKVISNPDHKEIEGSHHLGIHFFPEDEDYTLRFIRFLHDSREFLKHTQVIHGEFPFIKVAQDEVIERGVSHAYIKLKTIAGALNWAYTFPEKMMGKPALFEFIVKNTRFFYQHMLNALEGPQLRTKADLNLGLADLGLAIPPYKNDPEYIKGCMLDSVYGVLTLQSHFVKAGREANLDFLHEHKEYDWDEPGINDYSTNLRSKAEQNGLGDLDYH